ncbi:MAG: NAD(P)/FAD-dependent oxidoreductase [Candidatus Binataceae bacterium]
MESFDAIIIGAGAAGMMCALTAGSRGRRVLLIERGEQPGAKILISGGGRCNFSNREAAPECFISANSDFCKSALSRYTPRDFIAMVERHRIAYHEKTLGQLFCDRSARDILAMLVAECEAAHVALRTGIRVAGVMRSDRFRVATSHGDFTAPALVIATGGLSIPKMGASGFAYDIARRFGLPIVEPRPGFVPLELAGDAQALARPLSGVSLPVEAACGSLSFRESMLFTHRGLSGPVILQISSYWREELSLAIDLAPERDIEIFLKQRKRTRPKAELKTLLAEIMPARAASAFAEPHAAATMANLPDRVLATIANRLHRWEVSPVRTEGWSKAEVTVGGVDTAALSSKTMEARGVPGLFVIGEAVDVTGWLGGYNFQWAWSSGFAAGHAL